MHWVFQENKKGMVLSGKGIIEAWKMGIQSDYGEIYQERYVPGSLKFY
ncbi:hypothetical protein ACFLU1_03570 [Chloroflexota bacterium]